jgi:hypothetical protein
MEQFCKAVEELTGKSCSGKTPEECLEIIQKDFWTNHDLLFNPKHVVTTLLDVLPESMTKWHYVFIALFGLEGDSSRQGLLF